MSFAGTNDPWPTLVLAGRSEIDLARQVTAPGATWLDYRVERERMPLSMGGVGQEVREAVAARAEHLVGEGFPAARPRVIPQRDLLATLRWRSVDAGAARLSAEAPAVSAGKQPLRFRPALD